MDSKHKSRLTNHQGRGLLPGIDGRSAQARRFRDIASALAADQGGAEGLSEARIQMIRRFAAAAVQAEALEGRLVNGEPIDASEHCLLTSSMVRIVNHLGIDRTAQDITPAAYQFTTSYHNGHIDPVTGETIIDGPAEDPNVKPTA